MFAPSQAVQRIAAQSQRPARRPGPDVISLATGDPDFATPEHIEQALVEAIQGGYTHYVENQGDPDLRQVIAHQISARSGHVYATDQVVVTHGASGGLAAAILATINPGDRVVLPEPTYSLYADLVQLAGGSPVYVSQTPDFHLELEALEAEAAAARMIILCHPCNPTGVVYRREELVALARLAEQHDLLILCDEAYDHIVFDGTEFISSLEIPQLRDHLIYCQTFSKTYAMTGWRIGYLVAPPSVAAASARIHRTFCGALNAAVQRAALAALTIPSDFPERVRLEYQARRELVSELLAGAPGITCVPPDGTFYSFIRYESDKQPVQVVELARGYGVAIRAGTEYGPSGDHHVRIAFSSERQQLTEGLLRLRSVFTTLSNG
jgi:aspartate aminotransferase